ncbi:SDR family NAD(P)-dependent oxidoreductase [Psychrobacter sp. FDAARGOS_221]|uniref:SDR family NAD(P)-dependent oxidoreductase n=1 Tax=Psychrobacter sp. FDAARGOS_221 TaxID=1975705 RepID=UPI000BB54BA5|nr:SDR family oxidoreductase [Psychrobacter sp. FDAARGOS_221]PNK60579.1 dehydrogenase [Psychrobacter sp. FDAARGOS_221]
MKRFNDKVIIITGADSSLGRATALRLAREGANIVLIGMNDKVLSYIADELPEDHTWINAGNHLSVTSDITNHEQAKKLVNYVMDKYSHIDSMININTTVTMETPLLEELSKSNGNIVEVSLLSDTEAKWSFEAYAEAKQAAAKRVSDLALQYSEQGIRANAVVIGLTTADNCENSDIEREFVSQSPLGKLVELSEAVEVITFLADEDNRSLTGVTLPVDGGLSLKL